MTKWSKSHFGVCHNTINGLWITTEKFNSFTQVSIRRPYVQKPIEIAVFFRDRKPEDSLRNHENDFWSQGEDYEQKAKIWGEKNHYSIRYSLVLE